MNKRQENSLSMFDAVLKVCAENQSIWQGVPAYVTAFNAFKTKLDNLKAASQLQIVNTKNKTILKNEAKEKLIKSILLLCDSIMAYADKAENNALKNVVSITESGLLRLRDSVLKETCDNVLAVGQAELANLVDEGITQTQLDAVADDISKFADLLAAPRVESNKRSSATKDIAKYIAEIRTLLRQRLDRLTNKFESSHNSFYNTYKSARIIVDSGTTSKRTEET
jgi:hypothetical protein